MKLIHNLKELLFPWINNLPNCFLNNIELNSNKIRNGDLFIAIKGTTFHGNEFILQAIQNGASSILSETFNKKSHGKIKIIKNIPIIYFFHLSKYLSDIAGRFYRNPGKKITIIGVTGTNGKTTVTHLIAQWAYLLGEKVATIGTLGNGIYNFLQKTTNTTDSAVTIQSLLHKFIKNKINLVTIEVSSHGIKQNRVRNIPFEIGILTNISQDHLDYHKNMKAYIQEKYNFFYKHHIKQKIFNNEIFNNYLFKKFKSKKDILVSIKNETNIICSKKWIIAKKIIYTKNNIKIYFDSFWGQGLLKSHLLGLFNVTNMLLACSSLLALGYSIDSLSKTSKLLTSINGRMQKIEKKGKPNIIIDYAHTPEALQKVLKTLRHHCRNHLWCIFGCGGNRDKTKRSKMGIIAEKLSDRVIVTNDNPRNENPIKIAYEITKYCTNNVKIILKREEAITYAISKAQEKDLILIAGKGHEQFQIIGNKIINYSDQEFVHNLLEK